MGSRDSTGDLPVGSSVVEDIVLELAAANKIPHHTPTLAFTQAGGQRDPLGLRSRGQTSSIVAAADAAGPCFGSQRGLRIVVTESCRHGQSARSENVASAHR